VDGVSTTEAPAPTSPSTRERLLAAAIEVFRAEGYERARVQDIARAAGMTTGAIYGNYRDKAELLLAAMAAGSAAEVESLLEAGSELSSREVLTALGRRMQQPTGDRPLILDAVVAARRDSELAQLVRDALARRSARFAALVERGQADGDVDPDLDVDALTRFCLTLALGSVVVRELDLPSIDPNDWGTLLERLLDAVSPEPTTRAQGERP
jgi:AcrR family transcriptional regulator